MEPAKAKSAEVSADDDFLAFPIHNVVGVFEDVGTAEAAVTELRDSGFAENEITTYSGTAPEEKLNFSGSRQASLPALLGALQHYGPDRTYMDRHAAVLRGGSTIVMVHVTDKRHKTRAAEILHRHTKGHVTYFGTWVIQEV